MASTDGGSFPIRLAGAPPAPPPRGEGRGGVGSRSKKSGGQKQRRQQQQQQQQRHTLTVTPTLTLGELRSRAADLFGANGGPYVVRLLAGFPPRPIDLPDTTPASECVGRMENVIVRFEPSTPAPSGGGGGGSAAEGAAAAASASGGGGGRKRPRAATSSSASASELTADGGAGESSPSASSTGGGRRPRRAAAEAAASSFAATIKAQDDLARAERKKKPFKRKKVAAPSNGIASASSASRAASAAAAAASRRMQSMGGYRLSDGAAVAPTRPPPRSSSSGSSDARKPSGRGAFGQTMKSEDDVSYNLLRSLEGGGGGGGKVGKFLRAAMRGAVGKSYERSRAAVRVDAVRSGRYGMEAKSGSGGRLGGGGGNDGGAAHYGIYTVRYSKGVEGRGEYEEDVEIIGLDALKAVIRAVHADASEGDDDDDDSRGGVSGPREMLRPTNMAQLSPRVFWSLAHHFPNRDTEGALASCLPGLDWSYLGGRTRILSEKARENRRQERVARGEIPDEGDEAVGTDGDYDAAAGVVGAVEEAMERMHEDDRENARERAARAAMARFGGSAAAGAEEGASEGEGGEWRVVTPDELDEDELRECVREGLSSDESGPSVKVPESTVEGWVSALAGRCSVRNWRELANADPGAVRSALLSAPPVPDSELLTEDLVDAWVDAAQLRSVDEIILEILDGDQDALEALREEASAGTPKDLACWAAAPDMLLEEAPSLGGGGKDVRDVMRWCARAKAALGQMEWLEWYATPVA